MEILKILPCRQTDKKQNLNKIVRAIKNGQVIVCPTDTVYGLICDATNKKAVSRLFKIKKRPADKPTPVFVKDIKMAKQLAQINKKQEKFLKKIWPGAVTAVLQKKRQKGSIGVRIPNHKFVLHLVEHNGPLTETSANISGKPSSVKIKDVLKQFKGQKFQPDLVLDAGNLKKARPSKVIDLTVLPPKIIRY